MFWADKIAKDIIDSGKHKPYWVDDMKTPSGRIHVGSLRGVLIHDLVYKALLSAGQKATFTWVFEDHDPMDAFPHYLDGKKWSKYLGQPLYSIPAPDGKAENYAEYFASEFTDVFNKVGCFPKILWGSDLYKSGKMNDAVKLCLDNASVIRKIYEDMYKKKMQADWYPFQLVCPKCGKQTTTRISQWNGKEVTFTCKVDAVDWTNGCGHEGKKSPFSGDGKFAGKLSWKVEWPVKWQIIGVTIEGAGKDHMSAGGSHDVAKQVCEQILKYPVPYPVPYEFFLIGGRKMSSSKGVGSSAKEVSDLLPPYLLRFLFTRTDYNQAINFDPIETMVIPDLFDEYDRCYQAYTTDSDKDLSRAFEFSQIAKPPEKRPVFLPRFRDIANYIQHPSVDLKTKFAEIKGASLTSNEESILKEREQYARIWIGQYAPPEYRMHMEEKIPKEAKHISEQQKEFLTKTIELLSKEQTPDELQASLYELTKTINIPTKDAFAAIYLAFLGRPHGPKAAWFLLQYPKDKVIERLKEASEVSTSSRAKGGTVQYLPKRGDPIQSQEHPTGLLHHSVLRNDVKIQSLFTIDPEVRSKFPSVSVGIAIIKGVIIKKEDSNLKAEIDDFLKSIEWLTTEELGKYSEILSYRKIYKETGIDWHSRRPSPEALLRRVALGKGLYNINSCVDAYNLIVMKHRVSAGAFDYDKIQFPTILRFAKAGERIHLLGDQTPTEYKEGEIAYFDQNGGFNIDFNYRDAQRTAVNLNTKNLWINIDGVFDITPEQVEKTLKETIDIVQKYCGGTVELSGVIC